MAVVQDMIYQINRKWEAKLAEYKYRLILAETMETGLLAEIIHNMPQQLRCTEETLSAFREKLKGHGISIAQLKAKELVPLYGGPPEGSSRPREGFLCAAPR